MVEATTPATEQEALDAYSTIVTSVAEKVLPSVASLRIGRGGRGFGGAGSGVVITPDGFLVTSAHVVAAGGTASASFIDGTEHDIDVVGADPLSDLAIVRARTTKLHPVRIGNADQLRVGQLVVAIGNPMGFSGSVTSGVVSGLGRSLATADGNGHRRFVEDVIQTDAALNPGNSGGALADSQARLIGVNTAVAGMGLGLAVPMNSTTQAILAALMRNGRVRRAYLGIAGGTRPLPPPIAERLGRTAGVEVHEVVAGSPAANGKLRGGDVIVSVGDVGVSKAGDLQRLMVEARIGARITLTVLRGEQLLNLDVTPVELK
ncbi:MAG: PDZ domain-containing protein [Chloroflexi bacterium]|nr:MAG: PDZ domain-containing protein [Chloroflexota bacterium]TMF94575.1 MAG: PDZ domain-containing protein [Chloroflexota bacterium]